MNEEQLFNLILGAGLFVIILVIALCIPVIIAQWKLYKKAGKNGWEALIPFYSTWVLIEIAGLNWWYFLIAIVGSVLSAIEIEELSWLVTIASYFVNFLCYYNIAKRMKQNEVLYGVLGIIAPYIAVLILGFSKNITYDNYDNTIEVSPNGPIGASKNNNITYNKIQENLKNDMLVLFILEICIIVISTINNSFNLSTIVFAILLFFGYYYAKKGEKAAGKIGIIVGSLMMLSIFSVDIIDFLLGLFIVLRSSKYNKLIQEKYCPKCGQKLLNNANFCENCGNKIEN